MLYHSTKYDGGLHYRFDTTVVHESPTLLATFRGVGVPVESYRGDRLSKLNLLTLHWTDRHWNLCVQWYPDWTPREHYVNIGTPADWSDGTLRWTDLDLDLIWPATQPMPRLDDEDEFALHRVKYAYPAELCETCVRTASEVETWMRSRLAPFDDRLYAWRPGRPLPSLEERAAASR
jgi:protein associated with RNAse G/E